MEKTQIVLKKFQMGTGYLEYLVFVVKWLTLRENYIFTKQPSNFFTLKPKCQIS